jgi:FkbM family methyltransferase
MSLLGDIWRHPANRNRRLRVLAKGACWQIWKRFVRRPFTIRYHGYLLPCYPDSRQASAAIYFSGWPDCWEMTFMRDYLRPGDRFVDVGANIGLYTLLAASVVGPGGRVVAFEPGLVPAERLRETCAINQLQNIELVRCAVGEQAGELLFEAGDEDATAHISVGAGPTRTQVSVVRLDEFLPDVPYAMAKFDIEGYEPLALRGMKRLLAAGNPPVFLLEAAGYSKRYGVETHELMREIETWNYRPMIYDPARRLLSPSPAHWEMGLPNVLCVFEGARGLVSDRLSRQP